MQGNSKNSREILSLQTRTKKREVCFRMKQCHFAGKTEQDDRGTREAIGRLQEGNQ